ncbi:hypothetical protein LDENG_00082310 [Lucifuga dentata]|nr:hypothetical protein LDENG_00082310 [Lucifuga dentata]
MIAPPSHYEQVAPRSYHVMTEDGAIYRRNRRQLLKTKERFQPHSREEVVESEGINDLATTQQKEDLGEEKRTLPALECQETSNSEVQPEVHQQSPVPVQRSQHTRKPVIKLDLYYQVLPLLKDNPRIRIVFGMPQEDSDVTADVTGLLKPSYSVLGSNRRPREEELVV